MNDMTDIRQRAARRRHAAEAILAELELVEQWRQFGRPVLVGALAYDLMVSPDIDLEIYCPELKIEHGFHILSQCARGPRVAKARFSNELSQPDKALYWQLRYRDDAGATWKIDMWAMPEDYDLPRSEDLVTPMLAALSEETRTVILELKEQRAEDSSLACPSIDLYRAVLDDDVRCVEDFRVWLKSHETGSLTSWQPRPSFTNGKERP
ncbi:hypothetical protein ACFL34_06190 [Candidatus Sumerlaeota bacterium]